jgi:uncharacterized protein YndB with AHSA1/START domain
VARIDPAQGTPAETRSVVVEREVGFPPETVWRALTQPPLIEAWLMQTDFRPVVGHPFEFRADWGVVDCRVLEVVRAGGFPATAPAGRDTKPSLPRYQ